MDREPKQQNLQLVTQARETGGKDRDIGGRERDWGKTESQKGIRKEAGLAIQPIKSLISPSPIQADQSQQAKYGKLSRDGESSEGGIKAGTVSQKKTNLKTFGDSIET